MDTDPQQGFVNLIKRLSYQSFPTRIFILLSADAVAITISYLGALLICYSDQQLMSRLPGALVHLPLELIVGLSVFSLTRMYRTLWRYASVDAVIIIGYGTVAAVLLSAVI
jgi:FlaA1/EpsC-like NDP-sugar epimerase